MTKRRTASSFPVTYFASARSGLVMVILCGNTIVHAKEESNPIDLSFKMGGDSGTIYSPEHDNVKSATYTVGGMPLGIAWNRDNSFNWSTTLGAQMMIDIPNSQVMRQGFEGGFSYHLLGGSRRLVDNSSDVHTVSTSPYNFSVVGRIGFFNYSSSTKSTPMVSIVGSVFEGRGGFEYRRDLSASKAIGAEFISTIFSLPASVERISPRFIEFSLFLRTFL